MRNVAIACMILVFFGLAIPSYASDWDKAGKILTGIEGVRVLTGGKVDIIGAITGINSGNRGYDSYYDGYGTRVTTRVWVPQTVWEDRWVPAHNEFRHGYGWVFVPGHYQRYQVAGGYWVEEQPYYAQHINYRGRNQQVSYRGHDQRASERAHHR